MSFVALPTALNSGNALTFTNIPSFVSYFTSVNAMLVELYTTASLGTAPQLPVHPTADVDYYAPDRLDGMLATLEGALAALYTKASLSNPPTLRQLPRLDVERYCAVHVAALFGTLNASLQSLYGVLA